MALPRRKGILLINLGTPRSTDPKDVRDYLRRFLGDPRVIQMPRALWWPILHWMILPHRPQQSAKRYELIWDQQKGSPLDWYTKRQAQLLAQMVDDDTLVDYAYSYSEPLIPQALEKMEKQGVTDLTIIPLDPQYSVSTIGSIADDVYRFYTKRTTSPTLHFVNGFYFRPDYQDALAATIRTAWDAATEDGKPGYDTLLVSYHGIPKSYVQQGDPYEAQCEETTQALKRLLPDIPMIHAYQSKFGPQEWLTPATSDTLEQLPSQGKKRVLVVSPAFVSDCLETLEELELDNRNVFMSHGGERYDVVPCLNDSDSFIRVLHNIAVEA